MPNSGYGSVECQMCYRGCIVKTAVNRNSKMEVDVIRTRCDHFEMYISIYTNIYMSHGLKSGETLSFLLLDALQSAVYIQV